MEIKTYEKIYSDVQNYVTSHQDKLTDFNEGAVLSSQNEAYARELAELYIRTRVGYSTFLRSLPHSVFGFEVKTGVKASATIVFSRSKPFSYETTIPENTIVAAGGLQFYTTSVGVIPAGEMRSTDISVIAEEVGEKYNVGAMAINKMVTTLSADVVSVSNPQPATGGISAESWQEYVARFADYILGLGRTNGAGFNTGLKRGYTVRSKEIVEHFPPLNNLWNMTVYLEDGSGGMPQEGFDIAQAIIDGDGTPSNGGYRAPGIHIRYLAPEKVPISLIIKVVTTQDVTNEIDESVVIAEVQKKTKEFINALEIGKELVLSDLIVALKRITYIYDVKIVSPVENPEIAKSQIARYQDCQVIVEVG